MTIHKDFPLSQVLWYKVGGKTRYFIEAQNKEDVLRGLDFLQKNAIKKFCICGLGSNLIFSDSYFDGAVLQIAAHAATSEIKTLDGSIEVFAGEELDRLIQFSFANNRAGLEWAGGLPGTVGAGIRGNVGAFGKEIKDNFVSAEVLELGSDSFNTVHFDSNDLHFSYRNSVIKEKKNLVVLSATFQLEPVDTISLQHAKNTYNDNIAYRKTHHPVEYPTCGSVFKNIVDPDQVAEIVDSWPDIKDQVKTQWHSKVSMGYVIKRLGFSGYQVGQMQVSPKHCNFIINLGDGKASDVLAIIKQIKFKVAGSFGFEPEVEVEIVT